MRNENCEVKKVVHEYFEKRSQNGKIKSCSSESVLAYGFQQIIIE